MEEELRPHMFFITLDFLRQMLENLLLYMLQPTFNKFSSSEAVSGPDKLVADSRSRSRVVFGAESVRDP